MLIFKDHKWIPSHQVLHFIFHITKPVVAILAEKNKINNKETQSDLTVLTGEFRLFIIL